MKRILLASLLLAGCASFPFAHVSGTTLKVSNPTERHVIAKVTCSCRVFDGDFDRYFVLAPWADKEVVVGIHSHKPLVCAVESVENATPAEIALEVQQERRR